MPATPLKTFHARTLAEWRAWLADHHRSESVVWLVFHKLHTGRPSVAYDDALDEALCFGWIDSLVRRLDDDRYARKFTPRKPDSRWSDANRARYARLLALGRVTAAGLERPPTGRGYDRPPPAAPSGVPDYIRRALADHPAARATFERLAPSHRRRYVHWIHSAKREETRLRRLAEAVERLAAGKELGLK